MKILNRLKGLATGIAIAIYGAALMWRGTFEYRNSYSMTLYSPAMVATGVFICLLSSFPDSWVDWIVRRRKNR